MDLASSIQKVTEEILLRMGRALHQETGLPNLVMAGGVALNCVANGRLIARGPFREHLDSACRRGRRGRVGGRPVRLAPAAR